MILFFRAVSVGLYLGGFFFEKCYRLKIKSHKVAKKINGKFRFNLRVCLVNVLGAEIGLTVQ